jgi:hypothetical protein
MSYECMHVCVRLCKRDRESPSLARSLAPEISAGHVRVPVPNAQDVPAHVAGGHSHHVSDVVIFLCSFLYTV